jgi:putative acetyltransferase
VSLVVRRYEERDLDDLLSVWENASSVAHHFLTSEFLEQERYRIAHVYRPRADTWVAESDGEIVGFMALLENEVGGLFVQPTHQGKGIGRALLDRAQEIHGDLEVEVFEANSVGRKFYENYGFDLLRTATHRETDHKLLRLVFRAKQPG